MSERAQQQLELHFPDCPSAWLWRRKTNDGFTTLPRTLPLVMQAIDNQSKGQPAGHTLFCLWARSPDNPLLIIENPATFASEAGFDGERAVDTWRRRMKRLHALNFILPKRGPSGDFHYVLLLNPKISIVPSPTVLIGVPGGAAKSTPWCGLLCCKIGWNLAHEKVEEILVNLSG